MQQVGMAYIDYSPKEDNSERGSSQMGTQSHTSAPVPGILHRGYLLWTPTLGPVNEVNPQAH